MWLGEAESELSELMFFRGFHGEKNVFFSSSKIFSDVIKMNGG